MIFIVRTFFSFKKCEKIITIIPIIYGAFNHELPNLLKAENNGKLIIGNINDIREGNKIAMFVTAVIRRLIALSHILLLNPLNE